MPYFALFYDTVDNFVERRQPHRQAHLAHIDAAHRGGALLLAGALKPADSPPAAPGSTDPRAGALLVFRTGEAGDVEGFARADPYVTNGLVRAWRVREWAVVIGEHAISR